MIRVLSVGVALAAASGSVSGSVSSAGPAPVCAPLQAWTRAYVDSLRTARGIPGMVVAVATDGGTVFTVASGYADTAAAVPLRGDDLLLAGSVGKTFFAALALEMADRGDLDVDAPLTRYLGDEPWLARVPRAEVMTIRHLMTHTSGLVRYEFQDAFIRDLLAEPDRVWDPRDQVAYILDQDPPFAPGEGWEYSDTNYLVVAMVLERILGRPAYDEIRTRLLEPNGLAHVRPSTSRSIPGLVQGYGGPENPFGGYDAMIVDGRFVFNPQFEWAGGGYAVSGEDLARWAVLYGKELAGPRALAPDGAVAAPQLGRGMEYGLGVMKRPSPAGVAVGHAGYFPGYLTEMWYYPEVGVGVSAMVNTSHFPVVGPLRVYADRVAAEARAHEAAPGCGRSGDGTAP
jgi:D-alanyl-D-alanine carboxypeptidase